MTRETHSDITFVAQGKEVLIRNDGLLSEWVNGIWEDDFIDSPSLPPALEQDVADNKHYSTRLGQALDACNSWARIDFATLPQGMI